MKFAADNIFASLANYTAILQTEFAAPVLRGRPVVVTVDGDCRRVQIIPPMFQGWAVARLISPSTAIVIREADAVERQMLLGQWPTLSLHVCHVSSRGVLAVPLLAGAVSSPKRLHLCDDFVAPNDVVLARFDGRQCWFDRVIARNYDASAALNPQRGVLPDLSAVTVATRLSVDHEIVH
jgi:hypothetical protein